MAPEAPQDPTPEPGADTPTPDPAPTAPTPDAPLGEAGEKALEAWKTRARDAEKAAKSHEAELEKLRKAAMTEQEKAVAEAKDEGRREALTESGRKVAVAEIRAAAAGRDPEALAKALEFTNVDTFLTDDGEVDAEKVARFVSALPTSGAPTIPGVPAGARQSAPQPTLAEQIAEAQAAGDTKRFIKLQSLQLAQIQK
jgi:hypothetical protein